MTEPVELLFFDTFSHENSEELNLDLVQFPKPVFVSEVRVIPLGARVQADFPGGVRLGATNPSQFSIEFFVNDLGKPGASTFESLGGFDYNQNGCIHLECFPTETKTRRIPTDGLVLRGWYTTITLAVYGTLTRVITEQIPATVPAPVIPPQATVIPPEQPQIIPTATTQIDQTWPPSEVSIPPVQMEYTQPVPVSYGPPPPYNPPEVYTQDYPEYYNNEPPKDPRAYHQSDPDWESSKTRTTTSDRDHGRRDRIYSRSHSRDRDNRDYRDNSRDSSDYDARLRERSQSIEYREKDWDRYKHQDVYKRARGNSYDRDEPRKRPRTPPLTSAKRPHTPHGDVKDFSPGDVESISEEEIVGSSETEVSKHKHPDKKEEVLLGTKNLEELKTKGEDLKNTPLQSPNLHDDSGLLDVEEFEPILSDEEICDEGEQFADLDYDYSEYVNNDDLLKLFNPFNADIQRYVKPKLIIDIKDYLILDPDDPTTRAKQEKLFLTGINTMFAEHGEKVQEIIQILESAGDVLKQFTSEDTNGDIKEDWVQLCDQIPALLLDNQVMEFIIDLHLFISKCDFKNTGFLETNKFYSSTRNALCTIMTWVQVGLNFDYALSQVQPGFKIRHIKSGIRLTEALCSYPNIVELMVLQMYDVQFHLLDLYQKEYMALSIKLMIMRALDFTLWSKFGIEYFITTERNYKNSSLNGYQIILEMLRCNPLARIKFAINSVVNKLHAYEILENIKLTVGVWLKNNYLTLENEDCCNAISEKDIDEMDHLLTSILKVYRDRKFSMSQPKRFLPVSAQFEVNRGMDSRNICYVLFQMHNFLENCLLLMTHHTCPNMTTLTSSLLEILSELMHHQEGITFLTENIEVANMITRCLLQSANNEDDAQFSRAQQLGLCLSYKLQAMYHVEALFTLSKKHCYDYDATEILDQLHLLYCLSFSNNGKLAVADVLSTSNNILCLLQFVDTFMVDCNKEDEEKCDKLKKSPGMGYIIDLIALTVAFSRDITYLETYGRRLLTISNHSDLFEPSTAGKLNQIRGYLKPLETATIFNYEDITVLCEVIKNSIQNVSKLPEGLITVLRILTHLGVSTFDCSSDLQTGYTELKYKYVILQLYSQDGMASLCAILKKIYEYYEQPNLHSATLAAHQGAMVINIVLPCVLLIRKMITNVIACRNTQFKDLTSIPILLQTFTLMYAVPGTSVLYFNACKICHEIIETLLAFTQPVSEEVNENESLNKSLWTMMIGEIIKFITLSPYTFIPGLLVFSELLPLPFPIITRTSLADHETQRAVNFRKLWSAHLHSQSTHIQELINTLMASSYQPLLHLLRRVCIQLSDLAANSALMICRGILENIMNSLPVKMEKAPLEACTSHAARLLNFLASLLTHGAIKCAVMYLLRSNHPTSVKGDEKFPALVTSFCEILNIHYEIPSHLQAQECIISIIQSLCDTEITLFQNIESKGELSSDIYISNALPPKEMLVNFINTMLDHVMASDSSYTTILPIIRAFVLLTEHDYGFYHLQACIEKRTKPFWGVFSKFTRNFSKDNADCLATLSAMLEYLRICLATFYLEMEPGVMFTPRSIAMSPAEICSSLGWSPKNDDSETETQPHPMSILEKLLQANASEDDTLEPLSESLAGFIRTLAAGEAVKQETSNEPILPAPEPLLAQFNGRSVFTVTGEISDERMSAAYWLSAPSDEGEADVEQVPCDLSDMCRQLLPPEVNLCRETERICRVTLCADATSTDPKIKRNSLDQHRFMPGGDKLKRPFVTPMRGRGFLRTPPQRGDPFRSRPPNTSRPPSLHVDDFVALETCGAQPTGPTGYNKLSREIMSVRGTTRGRGRAFVSPERGAHFRQVGRGQSLWPGAHITESSAVTTLPQHFRVATDTPTHFSTVRGTLRGRGIPRLREGVMVVRHVRTFPR